MFLVFNIYSVLGHLKLSTVLAHIPSLFQYNRHSDKQSIIFTRQHHLWGSPWLMGPILISLSTRLLCKIICTHAVYLHTNDSKFYMSFRRKRINTEVLAFYISVEANVK